MTIVKIDRQSNIELLRIVAMFMIVLSHAMVLGIGEPNLKMMHQNTCFAIGELFSNSLTIVGVNIFVLISGWFGIRSSIKGFLNFIFLCLFYSISLYLITNFFYPNIVELSSLLEGIRSCFYLLPMKNWFVRAYICLYILAPMINSYVESATQKQLKLFLISFFLIPNDLCMDSKCCYVFLLGF